MKIVGNIPPRKISRLTFGNDLDFSDKPKTPEPTIAPEAQTPEDKVVPVTFKPGEYEFCNGRNVDKAPEILNAGKVISPFFYIAQRRINASTDKEKTDWHDNYFDTSDLVAYDSNQNPDDLKVILSYDSNLAQTQAGKKCLSWINPSELFEGGVNLENRYDSIQGRGVMDLKRSDLASKLESRLSKKDVMNSKLWRILLRHPNEVDSEFAVEGLHKNYIDWAFSAYKQRFDKDTKIDDQELMGVYSASAKSVPHMRAWYVSRLESRSDAFGRSDLGNSNGRFASIAPAAQGGGE